MQHHTLYNLATKEKIKNKKVLIKANRTAYFANIKSSTCFHNVKHVSQLFHVIPRFSDPLIGSPLNHYLHHFVD